MKLDPTIMVALIAAVGSLIVAIFGLITSGEARRLALKAEEASKRSEQVRLRATAAGEALLTAMAELLINAETVLFVLSMRTEKALTIEEAKEYFAPMAKAAGEIRRSMYSTALYTTPAIRDSVSNLLGPLQRGKIDLSKWESFVDALRAQHSEIAVLFQETYLR